MRGVVAPATATESQQRASMSVRRIRVERLDAATGVRRLIEREMRPVAGFGLVFSAPESVSLLHAGVAPRTHDPREAGWVSDGASRGTRHHADAPRGPRSADAPPHTRR
jgi:hypothetical protein